MRELMPRTPFLLPGRRRPGRPRRGPRARLRARAAPAASSPRRAPSSPPTSAAAARPPTRRAPRPSACGTPHGRSRSLGPCSRGLSSWSRMPGRDDRVAAPRGGWRRSRSWPRPWPSTSWSPSSGSATAPRDDPRAPRAARHDVASADHDDDAGATRRRTYTVRAGDTLSGDRRPDRRPARATLEQLNPDVDAPGAAHRAAAQARAVSAAPVRAARRSPPRCAAAPRRRAPPAAAAPPAGVRAPAAILVEPATGDVVFARGADAARARSPRRRSS